MGCVLNESGMDDAECRRKIARERRVAGVIRDLVNTRGLQLECTRVPFLLYGSETTRRTEKERSSPRARWC